MIIMRKHNRLSAVLLLMLLAGCASYHPKPLATNPALLDSVPHLTIDSSAMPLPELASHRFDPSDGLDMTEVATLAVVNNPDLKAARDEAGISRAQAFAAGLLPAPTVSFSEDFPSPGGEGLTNAYGVGLSIDVKALVTRSARKAAAGEEVRKTDLNILWQEWQVVGQVRLLFVQSVYQQRLMDILKQGEAIFSDRYKKARSMYEAGNLTVDDMGASLAALQDASRKVDELGRQMDQTRHDLNALLGLKPEVGLRLTGDVVLPKLDDAKVKAVMEELPRRRPDLLALAAGYQSQEETLRAAVLAQFPDLNIGVNRASDTSNVRTMGFGISMSLPLFDRNRGNIAIEDATRQKLYDEYQARISSAYSESSAALAAQTLLEKQLEGVNRALPEYSDAVKKAEEAYEAGDMDVVGYTNLLSSYYDKRAEAVELEETLQEQRVEVETLVGGKLPVRAAGGEEVR
jgi:outer membrane protein, heavy metal efflux system